MVFLQFGMSLVFKKPRGVLLEPVKERVILIRLFKLLLFSWCSCGAATHGALAGYAIAATAVRGQVPPVIIVLLAYQLNQKFAFAAVSGPIWLTWAAPY